MGWTGSVAPGVARCLDDDVGLGSADAEEVVEKLRHHLARSWWYAVG